MTRVGCVAVALVLSMFAFYQVNCDDIDDDETTCDVLRDIARDIDSANCTTNGNTTNGNTDCDTLRCMSTTPLATTEYNVTVLPCNKPPGIRVTLVVNGNRELDGRIFTESEDVNVAGGAATVKVTLDQLEDEHSIGVALRSVAPTFGIDTTFLNYTRIPVECEGGGATGVRGQVLLIVLLSAIMAIWQLL
ncbi:hypothetical protein GBAR_LOCUS13459 [Geodia barretti]|uniref:Uncharacterized protein n=1 Tax=Geodia barretti TaxID=519541 RepID=A0AA35S3X7_GEOBA|nr:hypothetical protein GBAR_LOCUS13459 [Geodia barretti]